MKLLSFWFSSAFDHPAARLCFRAKSKGLLAMAPPLGLPAASLSLPMMPSLLPTVASSIFCRKVVT